MVFTPPAGPASRLASQPVCFAPTNSPWGDHYSRLRIDPLSLACAQRHLSIFSGFGGTTGRGRPNPKQQRFPVPPNPEKHETTHLPEVLLLKRESFRDRPTAKVREQQAPEPVAEPIAGPAPRSTRRLVTTQRVSEATEWLPDRARKPFDRARELPEATGEAPPETPGPPRGAPAPGQGLPGPTPAETR